MNCLSGDAPLAVEVRLHADGVLARDAWDEPIRATHVEWRAHASLERGPIVSVTAFGIGSRNKTWMDPRYFVADGLDSSTPPVWIPAAPEWFWTAVESMETRTCICGSAEEVRRHGVAPGCPRHDAAIGVTV